MSAKTVQVHLDKLIIHWHRSPGCDYFWCGECGPDILFTSNMKDVTCKSCLRGMYRTKEYRSLKNKASK